MAALPDLKLLATEPAIAGWQDLGVLLIDAVFSPAEAARFADGWPALFRDQAERTRLARQLSNSAASDWGAPSLTGERPEPQERQTMTRRFCYELSGSLAPGLARWFAAGLTEKLQTAVPDHHWLLPSYQAWTSGPMRRYAAHQVIEHLRGTLLMYPLPLRLSIVLAPETYWCLFLMAASFHSAQPLYKLTWGNWLRRLFGLSYHQEYIPVVHPLDQLRLVAERLLALTEEWAGGWDQFVLTAAWLRWDMPARWQRLSPQFYGRLLTLPHIAATMPPRGSPPAASSPETESPSWTREGWQADLPEFLARPEAWWQSLAPGVPSQNLQP